MAIWKRAFDGLGGAPDISGKSAVDAGPGEGTLDHPSFGLEDKAGVGAFDDLDRTRGGCGDPRSLVAGGREDALEEREAASDLVQDQRCAVAILHAGGVDLDAQHQAEGVGDQMPLAALDPLSGVNIRPFRGPPRQFSRSGCRWPITLLGREVGIS